MIEVRCKNPNCNKFFFLADVFVGAIKCRKCKMIFEYQIYNNTSYSNKDYKKDYKKDYARQNTCAKVKTESSETEP